MNYLRTRLSRNFEESHDKFGTVGDQVVKVADFGVARVQAQSGIMTAETGTYRWMAPEVRFLSSFSNG